MHWITSLLGSLVLAMTLSTAASGQDLENTLYMDLEDGRVVIQLRPTSLPSTSPGSRSWCARASTTASSSTG